MDVRFGDQDYARLADELKGLNPDTRPHHKGEPDPSAAGK